MAVAEWAAECDADVLVSFGESLQVYAGLLTVATVCGGLCGALAASLLYVFCVKPLVLTKQVSTGGPVLSLVGRASLENSASFFHEVAASRTSF